MSRDQAIALVASLVVGALLWTKRKKSLAVITMSKVGSGSCRSLIVSMGVCLSMGRSVFLCVITMSKGGQARIISNFDYEYGCVFDYGEKCIFLCDNMSKECQDVPDNVEVKVIFVRENFHTGTFFV